MNHMNKWKISLYVAGIFLAGVITGTFATFAVGRHLMMSAMGQQRMAAHWLGELQSKLDLSPSQAAKIKPIIDETMTGFRNVFADQILAAASNSNVRIAAELTPEQRVKFAEIEKQQQEFIRSRFRDEPGNPKTNP